MQTTRRTALLGGLGAATAGKCLTGCSPQVEAGQETRVTVLGVIHGRHRDSESYSLDVLREAVRAANPDVILTEIPPDRIDRALTSFVETGEVDEPRTRVFPEYTDVVFPLTREMDFRMVGAAGWTRELADERSAALRRIENDFERASQWAEHRAARREYSRAIAGRADDPRFIHTLEYDVLVQRAQTPYQIYFDSDLGPGGWTRINAAHTARINDALDMMSGKRLNVLIMFGAWHKYMIERSLLGRTDIAIQTAKALFE